VQINLVTRDGSVVSVPQQAARLAVDLRQGKTAVVAQRGAAKVAVGGRISVVGLVGTNGEVQGLTRNTVTGGAAQTAASNAATNATLSLLLKATAGQSLDAFLTNRANSARGGFFYPSITCKDYIDNPRCIRRSPKQ
jgi:hypothetical protein